jgi:tetratricopeptide (TPR) repeat protein
LEFSHFFTWSIAIALVAMIGGGAMFWAYRGRGSVRMVFSVPVVAANLPEDEASTNFQQGCDAFTQGRYYQAQTFLNQAIARLPNFAEAYHNLGLTCANLRQDNEAVANLLRASELYGDRGDARGIALVKEHLETLRDR